MTLEAVPRAYATVTGTDATFITPDGHAEPITAAPDEDIRRIIVQHATDLARRTGVALELITSGDRGEHRLLVSGTGELTSVPATRAAERARTASVTEQDADLPVTSEAEDPDEPGDLERPQRASFITPRVFEQTPATGWRGTVSAFGIRVPDSARQRQRRIDEANVSRHVAGCRALAVANGKGGIGKTMTTAMLAAVFARFGGGNVLAWDNNDTRGTLGWRTEQGSYDTTIRDLLPATGELLAPSASVSDISRFVHHQSVDRYDVLRSNPELLATHLRIESAQFAELLKVATRYYRLVVFDSGNDESADRWLRMIDASHQLVIPTLPSPESAESAALLLEALRDRDEHSARLAENAVLVVTQSEPGARKAAKDIAAGFAGQVRTVQIVPFDHALKSGPLRFDSLRTRTKDAWLRVASAASTGWE
ncbi:MinD-like ATPase involved in chromosome partitioning or flagellar assembly [Microbacterium sp. W4I4]|uniref:MinD/ParA family ATP-binding protein n=1 Tax=Microbacterium sp. W4I4 TaxID=3042295 RepID=UPI0027843739|nr:AAA family ATPase [Microbacterium sp. W4I4]MDQ0615320.1 MinD-like ATPase involved in chromosome partitioning or flagellar assembly [Microbacterium sp. W4I4]